MNDERWLADDLVDPDVYAKGVDDGWTDIELYRLIVRQLQRSFHSGTEADRQAMLANRPQLMNTRSGTPPWPRSSSTRRSRTATTHPPGWTNPSVSSPSP